MYLLDLRYPVFDEIKDMVHAGIRHFRIDGIFHDADYVIEALKLYKSILQDEVKGREVFEAYKRNMKRSCNTWFLLYKTSKVKEG